MRASHRVYRKDDPKAHFEFCALPDCVYLSGQGICRNLNVKTCVGEGCAFQTNSGHLQKSNEKWKNRLLALNEEKQAAIARKYYGGNMPWRDEWTSIQWEKEEHSQCFKETTP